jgi:hypothetical protein
VYLRVRPDDDAAAADACRAVRAQLPRFAVVVGACDAVVDRALPQRARAQAPLWLRRRSVRVLFWAVSVCCVLACSDSRRHPSRQSSVSCVSCALVSVCAAVLPTTKMRSTHTQDLVDVTGQVH